MAAAAATRAKPIVLCVDDEAVVRSSLKEQLRRYLRGTARVEVVESGEAALEVVAELAEEGGEVPVIISDQIMPGLKGDELLRMVHERYPKTLTILLTGQASPEAIDKAKHQANLYLYMTKPWDGDSLREAVGKALEIYYDWTGDHEG